MYQTHHIEPVSLYGENKRSNTIDLIDRIHIDLHKTLDIPMRSYSKMQRVYKENTNHKLILDPEDIEYQAYMKWLFFDNIHKLSPRLQQEHIKKMIEQLEEKKAIYRQVSWDEFDDTITPHKNDKQQFFEYFNKKISCQKEIQKVLIEKLKLFW